MEKKIWKNEEGEQMVQYRLTFKDSRQWLANVFMKENGWIMISSEFGDWSWRFCFNGSFEDFILQLDVDYFSGKVRQGWNYLSTSRQMEKSAKNFAEHVLTALQEAINESRCNEICAL